MKTEEKSDLQKMTKSELIVIIERLQNPNGLIVMADLEGMGENYKALNIQDWSLGDTSDNATKFPADEFEVLINALNSYLALTVVDGVYLKIVRAGTGQTLWESGKDKDYFFRETRM